MQGHDDGEMPMVKRGSTRPEMGGGEHQMSQDDRHHMMVKHHHKTQWVYWALVLLGIWTIAAPFTFGYDVAQVQPSGGRGVWLGMENRAAAMLWSDVISGALLVFFGWRSLKPGRPVSQWLACGVGVWLSMAPVLFWAPTAAAYFNGTTVGMLVIALTVLIPGMPSMIMYMKMGEPTPPGWSYNPSSWAQRSVLIALGFAGLLASRYLAAFQLVYIDTIWDPFFGSQTPKVLNSEMSHMWPVSDAAFGTFAYTLEFLMGFMGSQSRWRTMPWMVALYGFLVIPLGMVHILLVISQPVVVGAWCTFCLVAAALMLPMISLEGDEVVAMMQHVRGAKRRGESVWQVFWKGGSAEGCTPDHRSPPAGELAQHAGKTARASVWGFSVPWTLLVSAVIGVALMATPGTLNVGKPAASVFHLAGALVVSFSVISMGEVFRLARFTNVLLGTIIAALPIVLSGASVTAMVWGVVAGLAVIALAVPRGPVKEHYGTWDKLVAVKEARRAKRGAGRREPARA